MAVSNLGNVDRHAWRLGENDRPTNNVVSNKEQETESFLNFFDDLEEILRN